MIVPSVALYGTLTALAMFALSKTGLSSQLSNRFKQMSFAIAGVSFLSGFINRINQCRSFSNISLNETNNEIESEQPLPKSGRIYNEINEEKPIEEPLKTVITPAVSLPKPRRGYIDANFQNDPRINNEEGFEELYKSIKPGACLIKNPTFKSFQVGNCTLRLINHTPLSIDLDENRVQLIINEFQRTNVRFDKDSCDVVAYHMLDHPDVIFLKAKDIGKGEIQCSSIHRQWSSSFAGHMDRLKVEFSENPVVSLIENESLTLINHTNYSSFMCQKKEINSSEQSASSKKYRFSLDGRKLYSFTKDFDFAKAEVFSLKKRGEISLCLPSKSYSAPFHVLLRDNWFLNRGFLEEGVDDSAEKIEEKAIGKLRTMQQKAAFVWLSFSYFGVNKDAMFEISKKLFYLELKI